MTNPLLDSNGLPRFADVRPEHITPAVDELIAAANIALERATSDAVPPDYDALSAVLDVATENLGRAWGVVEHLNAVADTPASRAAYTENLPKITEFHTRLGADERLFAKYRAVMASPAAQRLSAPRKRALENALRDFKLSGAELVGAAKQRFAELQELQADLSQKYSEHVLDATDGFACFASLDEMLGVPDDAMQAARAAAAADGKDGYKITLHFPSYFPVMQYGENRALREKLYTAYATRASELGAAEHDNSAAMRELLELRHEEALLLGFRSYAELSLVPKMAQSPAQVTDFLRDLARRARASAERDLAELREFARDELGLPELNAWDMPFASEKLKEKALRLQRTGGEAVLHRTQGARRPVSHHRDAVRGQHPARHGAGLAPQRALLSHRARQRRRQGIGQRRTAARRPVLPRPVCTRRQTPRGVDGRRVRALGAPRRPLANTGRPPGVQLRGAA